MKYTVYSLRETGDNTEARYIGCAKNPQERINEHCCKARNGSKLPVHDWMRGIEYNVTLTVLFESDSKYDAYAVERALITNLPNLLNTNKWKVSYKEDIQDVVVSK